MDSNENPYSAPTQQPAEDAPHPVGAFRLEDPRRWGRLALGLLSVAAILNTFVVSFMAIAPTELQRRWPLDKITLPVPLFSIGGIVVYLMWLHRCAKNALYLNGKALRISPGMAVGCYFIPFYNMIAPLLSMAEIVEITERHSRQRKSASGLLLSWWLFWLGSVIITAFFQNDIGSLFIARLAANVALILFGLIILRVSAAQAAIVIDPASVPPVSPPPVPDKPQPPPVEYDY